MNKEQQFQNNIYAIILFLLWPFLSLVFAIKDYKRPWAKNIVWFFVAFFGYTMVISNVDIDANRLISNFYFFHDSVKTFNDIIEILRFEPDYFMIIFNYYITRFVDNPRVYLFFLALIFGFFYSRNIWFLLNMKKGNFKLLSLFLLILFVFVVPFWNINGFRFWTATIIFVYGILHYFLDDNKKYLFWSFSCFLIHYSFLLPIGILVLYLLIGKKKYSYYVFYIVTFFFLQIAPKTLNSTASLFYLPTSIESEILVYSSQGNVERKNELNKKGMHWYVTIGPVTARYMVFILVTLVLFRYGNYLKEERLESIFSFGLLMLGVAQLVSSIPSGGRFIAVAYLPILASLFLIIQNTNIHLNSLVQKFSLFSIAFYVALTIRVGFDTIGVSTLLGNPLFAAIGNIDYAIIELIK